MPLDRKRSSPGTLTGSPRARRSVIAAKIASTIAAARAASSSGRRARTAAIRAAFSIILVSRLLWQRFRGFYQPALTPARPAPSLSPWPLPTTSRATAPTCRTRSTAPRSTGRWPRPRTQPQLADVYRRLAEVEERHAGFWEERLRVAGQPVPPRRPSRRSRTMAWLARRFGPQVVLPTIVAAEGQDSSGYGGQPETRGTVMPGEEALARARPRDDPRRHPRRASRARRSRGSRGATAPSAATPSAPPSSAPTTAWSRTCRW